jgi:hypothetical protein
MNSDPRCCGSGACIIDDEGRCWCGQQWDGETMLCTDRGGTFTPTAQLPRIEDKDAD